MQEKVYDVFISYRSQDGEELANRLNDYLTGKDIRVYLDKIEMEPGKPFPEQLRNALAAAPHYVLIGSANALTFREGEDWVRTELSIALENAEKDSERTLTVLVPPGVDIGGPHPQEVAKALTYHAVNMNTKDYDTIEKAFGAIFGVAAKASKLNLWHAAQKWFENSKRPGGRFARLHIDESIMPKAGETERRSELPINVSVDEKDGESVPLAEAIAKTKGHMFLIGEGGIGKTTSLMKIIENAYAGNSGGIEGRAAEYDPDAPVPIFIELSFAPDNNGKIYEHGKSTFIRRSVYKQLRERRSASSSILDATEEELMPFTISAETAVSPVNILFSKKTDRPDFLLLLDGLNEVSTAKVSGTTDTVIDLIRGEIRYLLNECPNVRVVLTSRTDDVCSSYGEVKKLYLSGIDEESIRAYLEKQPYMTSKKLERALSDDKLRDTLRIPLFLTMYAKLKNRDVCTRGEILRCFFHERRENIEAYTAASRVAEVGDNFSHSAGSVDHPWLTAEMQLFILDLILPEIACDMEKNGAFYYSKKKLRELTEAVLYGRGDTDPLGIYGDDALPITNKNGAPTAPSQIANEIKSVFIDDINKITGGMIDCAVYSLGIMAVSREDGKTEYGFMHQHIRDYFAAARHINAMRLSRALFADDEADDALEVMNRLFKEHPVGLHVREFIGEALGEHYNKPYCKDEKWYANTPEDDKDRCLLTRALDIYRGRKRDEGGYGVYSLVRIIHEARGELSGIDFSGIDFTRCSLNGMRLSRGEVHAKLDNAVLGWHELECLGHTGGINSASFSPDGRRIVTASEDGTAKIWDAESLELLGTLEEQSGVFNSEGNKIFNESDHTPMFIYDFTRTLNRQIRSVKSAAFSQDGSRIVTASSNTASIWNAISFSLVGTLNDGHSDQVNSAAFSPDGGKIVTASNDKTAKIWDANSFSLLYELRGHTDSVRSAAFSPDGRRIVTASNDHTAKIWDANSFSMLGTLEGHESSVNSAAFSPDGKRIVTASGDHTVKVWDARSFSLLGTLAEHGSYVNSAAFSPDGEKIVTASIDGVAKVWDAESFSLVGTLRGHSSRVNFVAFSSDESRIVTASDDDTAKIWDAKNLELLCTINGYSDRVRSVVLSPDGSRILTISYDKAAKVWDTGSFSLLDTLTGHSGTVDYASFSPDGGRIFTVSRDGSIRIWDASSFPLLGTLEGHPNSVRSAAFSSDGCKILAATSWGEDIMIWDASSFSLLGTLEGQSSEIRHAAFSPDGNRIVTVSNDETTKVWDAESFELLGTLEGHSGQVISVGFSHDGSRIVTISYDKTASIWNADSLSLLGTLEGHSDLVKSVIFSPDGSRIITVELLGKGIKIWDARSFSLLGTHEWNNGFMNSLAFSPDGSRIVTASDDHTARIIDADSLELLKTLKGHTNMVDSAAFSPDGSRIVTASADGTVKIWDATTYECIKTIPNVPGMIFVGVDFTRLAPGCGFTDEEKELLRMYGAIV